ncbi:MAG TPA: hypothetical protein VNQ32_13835 [Steroidobacteraceae bacterium]|nr:hypothetical protein [Steroidobacteraceae bacterium]
MLSFATASLVAPPTLACIPASHGGNLEKEVLSAYKQASAVVLAEVVEARFQKTSTAPFDESPVHRARLKVLVKWKGRHDPGSLIETTTQVTAAMCDAVLAPGELHLLYLRGSEPYSLTSARHLRLEDASHDIGILGDRYRRAPEGSAPEG